MAICDARETYRDRGLTIDEVQTRVLVRSWDVFVDAINTPTTEVADAIDTETGNPLPVVGDPHPDWPAAVCRKVDVKQDTENPFLFVVRVDYTSENEDPEIEWDPIVIRRAVDVADRMTDDGTTVAYAAIAMQNSAEDPFEPPPEIEEGQLSVTITVDRLNFDDIQAAAFDNAVNRTDWYGFPPETAKLRGIRARRYRKNGQVRFRTTYVIDFRLEKTWHLKIQDRGSRKLAVGPAGTVKVEIKDRTGLGPAGRYPLDGFGGELSVGDDPVFLRYRVYRNLQDFNALGLPDPRN